MHPLGARASLSPDWRPYEKNKLKGDTTHLAPRASVELSDISRRWRPRVRTMTATRGRHGCTRRRTKLPRRCPSKRSRCDIARAPPASFFFFFFRSPWFVAKGKKKKRGRALKKKKARRGGATRRCSSERRATRASMTPPPYRSLSCTRGHPPSTLSRRHAPDSRKKPATHG